MERDHAARTAVRAKLSVTSLVAMDRVALLIHGVGNPQKGEVLNAVKTSHPLPGVTVEEVCWNDPSLYPVRAGIVLLSALEHLLVSLGRASLLCPEAAAEPRHRRLRNLFDWIRIAAFVCGELSAVGGCALLVIVWPLAVAAHVLALVIAPSAIVSPRWTLGSAIPFPWIFITSLAVVLAMGLIASCVEGSAAELWIALRQSILLALRPLLLTVFCVFMLPWVRVREFLWRPGRAIMLVTFQALVVSAWITGIRYGLLTWTGQYTRLLVLFIAAPVATLVLAILLQLAVGPVMKILLDIFRYIAEPDYRSRIQAEVTRVVNAIRANSADGTFEVFIVGHSLGSVIALDSLLNSAAWKSDDVITLVTLGSPLRRFFFRFFPDLFFPGDPARSAARVAARVNAFRWVNLYRPWDQIGARLDGSRTEALTEISTGQRRFIEAHIGYWNDEVVSDLLFRALAKAEFVPGGRGSAATEAEREIISNPPWRRLFSIGMAVLAVLLAITAMWDGIASGFRARRAAQEARAAVVAGIMRDGIDTTGDLSYFFRYTTQTYRPPDGSSGTSQSYGPRNEAPYTILKVTFTDNGGKIHKAVMSRSGWGDSLYDLQPRFAEIDELDRHLQNQKVTTISGQNEIVTMITAEQKVKVRYLPGNPDMFVTTETPPHSDTSYALQDLIPLTLTVLFAVIMATFGVCLPWLRLALGETAFGTGPVTAQ